MRIWPFCEVFYGRPPVANLCLKLQDEYQLHVGLIIWLCWHCAHQRFVSRDLFQVASLKAKATYEPFILPLRSIRKQLKHEVSTDAQGAYQHVLSAEILMEKVLLTSLESELNDHAQSIQCAETYGLQDYFLANRVDDSAQHAQFLYASALSCVAD
ncbi:MAG TPA: TIGR02444 family protein [Marinagarivorans sp.]